jgi:hypothetical protein
MAVVRVPKPPAGAFNLERPVSSLLKTQIVHLQEAEFRLPVKDQTNIYINRIKTEGEAADYIRKVTEQLHPEAASKVVPLRKTGKRQTSFAIAASAVPKRKSKKRTSAKLKSSSKSKSKTKSKSKSAAGPKGRKKRS